MTFDVLTIGDYSLDIIFGLDEKNGHVHLDRGKNELALVREDKILVDDFHYAIGGNACNVAVGLARLGLKTSYQTFYGNEWWSKYFLEEMKNEQVDLSLSWEVPRKASNYSTSIFFQNEKTILIHNSANNYKLTSSMFTTKILFISSIGPNFESFFEELSDHVYRQKTVLAFNPASHQFEKNLSSYRNLLAVCEFLFVNKKEAQKILDLNEENDINNLIKKLIALGPKNIVMTDQTNGAYLYTDEKLFHCPIFPYPVKQKTGAGDAFASGFLAGYFYEQPLTDALRWGTFNAASVIGQDGPHEGLLHKEEMEKFLNENQQQLVIKQINL